MPDSSGAAGGSYVTGYFTPIQDAQEPDLDLQKLALNMLRQAILDIPDRKLQSRTLLWINDSHPDCTGWITSFETVCELLGRDVKRTRRMLNLFAASGLRMDRVRDGALPKAPPKKPAKGKRRRRKGKLNK
jgi:hypothetical protein